jgi:hypothetical protein
MIFSIDKKRVQKRIVKEREREREKEEEEGQEPKEEEDDDEPTVLGAGGQPESYLQITVLLDSCSNVVARRTFD